MERDPSRLGAPASSGEGIRIEGPALHSGRDACVTLRRRAGGVVLSTDLGSTPLAECVVRSADHGVRIGNPARGVEVESVEHLFAALGAFRVHGGLEIRVEGGEIPLTDGGAKVFADAVASLALPPEPAPLVVVARGRVDVGPSSYVLEPGSLPTIDVEVDFDAPEIGIQRADWNGRSEDFVSEIAWARTFGFRRDAAELFARGRARGASPEAVMVLDDRGRVEPPGAPARPSEFARHKLLDLIGDLYLFGGPPLGSIFARRPGHAATHRAVHAALKKGLLRRGASS